MGDVLRRARPASLLLVAVALVAVAGCGGSDGGGSDDATAAQRSGTEQKQVANAMRELRDQFNEADGKSFCDGLTADGREEVLEVNRELKLKQSTCPGIVREFARAAVANGAAQRVVVVLDVKVDGDRARVVMKGGLAGIRRVVPFRLVRVGGEWKLDDPLSGPRRVIRTDPDPAPRA